MPTFPFSQEEQIHLNRVIYDWAHRQRRYVLYRGLLMLKYPTDLLLYHRVLWETRPKWVIETGTKFGASAVYLQDQLDLIGEGGRVVTIDIDPKVAERDPRITYITGSSKDRGIIAKVKEMIGSDSAMVVLDSDHERRHVKWELHLYAPMVTPGQYLVVEDCHGGHEYLWGPGEARDWFLRTQTGQYFEQTNLDREFVVGWTIGGWLRRNA